MSDFQRNEFGKRRRIERQLRPQLRKDAEIPDQVYRSAGKAYKMILDGTVRQEAVQEDFEKKPKRGEAPSCLRWPAARRLSCWCACWPMRYFRRR